MTNIQCTPEVQMIKHSISEYGVPLKTFQLKYWRPIHSELMTHRVFSRNAGSSRARPVKGIIEQVLKNPWGPSYWGQNQKGMKAEVGLSLEDIEEAKRQWLLGAMRAAKTASALENLKLHKQCANRVLEPFTHIDVVVTSTAYNNWYALRNHKDAQPEIRDLAAMMLEVDQKSEPTLLKHNEWHLPYITEKDIQDVHVLHNKVISGPVYDYQVLETLRKISSARCARISYKNFEGNFPPIPDDLALYASLVEEMPVHASPTEHQATPDVKYLREVDGLKEQAYKHSYLHGNLYGWIQHRKLIPNEFVRG